MFKKGQTIRMITDGTRGAIVRKGDIGIVVADETQKSSPQVKINGNIWAIDPAIMELIEFKPGDRVIDNDGHICTVITYEIYREKWREERGCWPFEQEPDHIYVKLDKPHCGFYYWSSSTSHCIPIDEPAPQDSSLYCSCSTPTIVSRTTAIGMAPGVSYKYCTTCRKEILHYM